MTERPALKTALNLCRQYRVELPADLVEDLEALGYCIKAMRDYDNILHRLTAQYIQDLMTRPLNEVMDYGIVMADVIRDGLNEAWRRGMLENGQVLMADEWQDIVDNIVLEEISHLPDFAAFITTQAETQTGIGAAIVAVEPRLMLWVSRYEDVYNRAVLETAGDTTKLKWHLGATEEHCATCAALNGIVAYAREWEQVGFKPQSPPNPMLDCEGWKCDCSLVPTLERKTYDALDKLYFIATSRAV